MPVRFLLDEHLRGLLLVALERHAIQHDTRVDVLAVGDPPDLPLGSPDPEILRWTEREGRILITRDKKTMISHLQDHTQAGGRSPGIFMLLDSAKLTDVLDHLLLVAGASDEHEWQDRVEYIR